MEARISSARVRTTKGRIIYSLCFLYPFTTSVADPGERPMGPALLPPPPIFLDQTEAQRAEKKFSGDSIHTWGVCQTRVYHSDHSQIFALKQFARHSLSLCWGE